MEPPLILLVAGDPSGDLHGSALARSLKASGARVAAVGGTFLRREADEFIEDLAAHAITGFWEPAAKLGFLLRLGARLNRFLRERRPAAAVCIDYYGFNRCVLELAKAARVPAYYFISPQVWASRPGRVRTLKRLVRKMLVIFPFEADIYRRAGVPAAFVGHPLLDLIPPPPPRPAARAPFTIGLLPGSRGGEVRRHLPVFLESLDLLRRRFGGLRALLFASPHLPDAAYGAAAGRAELVRETGYLRRGQPDLVLSSSGTATLENALLGVPMIVVYKMSWPTYAVARALIRVPRIAMANILAGRELVPELIQGEAVAGRVAEAAAGFLDDPQRLQAVREKLLELRGRLGESGAPARAAREIIGGLRADAP
ncbi:MAG: lipid-A-disaccharide synthase [Elusimicrobia bacterium]|nr:lipid-A-disaccharide synthase [Elusimicrobiota bacterium]